MQKRKIFCGILLCVCMLFSLFGCKEEEEDFTGKSFCYSLSAEPDTLDPQIASGEDASTVILALYEGLVRVSLKGDAEVAVPGVAESWKHNADYTQWIFRLREDAMWSDNETPVTAQDFVYAFQRALDPATGSQTCFPLYCIKNARDIHNGLLPVEQLGVRAENDHTLAVELEYSNKNFPLVTVLPVAMPCNEAFFMSTSGRYGLEKSTILGNGPFVIDGRYGWEEGKHINVKASATYSGEENPFPSDIKFTISNKEIDLSNPLMALTSGTVDAISLTEEQTIKAEEVGCSIVSFEDTVWGLCFNAEHELLQSRDMRRYFMRALDRDQLTAFLPRGSAAAQGVISPAVTLDGEPYRKKSGPLTFSMPASAEELQNWRTQGMRSLSVDELSAFTVIFPKNQKVDAVVNEILKVWNEQISLYFNMEALEPAEYDRRIVSGDFAVAVCEIRPESDGLFSTLAAFQSGSDANIARYSSEDYDALLEQIAQSSGSEAASLALQAENMLVEDCVFLPLYTDEHYYGIAPGVMGIRFLPYGGGVDFTFAGKE